MGRQDDRCSPHDEARRSHATDFNDRMNMPYNLPGSGERGMPVSDRPFADADPVETAVIAIVISKEDFQAHAPRSEPPAQLLDVCARPAAVA
jgi:hypothetical protein